MSKLELDWVKCTNDKWCNFLDVNLDNSHFDNMNGVYIIWHRGDKPAVVYVGQGSVRDRISVHRKEEDILDFQTLGLYVTWASVAIDYRDGVERFLADKWKPKVGDKHPDAIPIVVNSPWKK